jgi:hypothetical protein
MLEARRAALEQAGYTRKSLKALTSYESKVPKEMYYDLRKGLDEGFRERSRGAKTILKLKGLLKRSITKRTLLGAGAGIGAGLLGATALGHFD